MTTPATTPGHAPQHRPRQRALAWLDTAMFAGVGLAIVGAGLGIGMAAHDRQIDCPNGTSFAEGETDFRCFSHPHLAEGLGLIVVSVMLGLLILLVGALVRQSIESRTAETPTSVDDGAVDVRSPSPLS